MFTGHVCKVLKSNIHLQAAKEIQFRGSEFEFTDINACSSKSAVLVEKTASL